MVTKPTSKMVEFCLWSMIIINQVWPGPGVEGADVTELGGSVPWSPRQGGKMNRGLIVVETGVALMKHQVGRGGVPRWYGSGLNWFVVAKLIGDLFAPQDWWVCTYTLRCIAPARTIPGISLWFAAVNHPVSMLSTVHNCHWLSLAGGLINMSYNMFLNF